MQKLGLAENFWFGHQGFEYVDLGRAWQIFLWVGLLLWLGLMVRALRPALKTGRVALRLGRAYIGNDLSAEYIDELAPERLTVQMGMGL